MLKRSRAIRAALAAVAALLSCAAPAAATTNLAPVAVNPHQVYVLGDSYTFDMQGTRYSGGCTSGHGVCGLSRFSPRSLVATLSFIAAGFATVYFLRHLAGS